MFVTQFVRMSACKICSITVAKNIWLAWNYVDYIDGVYGISCIGFSLICLIRSENIEHLFHVILLFYKYSDYFKILTSTEKKMALLHNANMLNYEC